MDQILFLVQIITMVFFLLYGLKVGSAMGAGIFSIFALFIMLFVFRLPAGSIPWVPIIIILAISIVGGLLEASGGLEYIVYQAGRIIQAKPELITFIAPIVVFCFVFGVGTANIAFALEPIIYKTALKGKVRPERPLVASVTAANMGLLCSPAASSALTAIALLSGIGFDIGSYLLIALTAGVISTLALSCFMCFVGKNLEDEPRYQELVKSGALNLEHDNKEVVFTKPQILSVVIFLSSIMAILALGLSKTLVETLTVPLANGIYMPSSQLVILFMFVASSCIIYFTKIPATSIFKTKIFTAAIAAAIAVLGPGWLGATIFNAPQNLAILKSTVGVVLQDYPWLAIVICGIVATFVMSQTAIINIVYPLCISLGVPAGFLAAMVQAVNVNYFIPAQPILLFAEELDQTGTTQKYRFMFPGIFSLTVSTLVGIFVWKTLL